MNVQEINKWRLQPTKVGTKCNPNSHQQAEVILKVAVQSNHRQELVSVFTTFQDFLEIPVCHQQEEWWVCVYTIIRDRQSGCQVVCSRC